MFLVVQAGALVLMLAQVASWTLFPPRVPECTFWGALSLLWLEAVRPSSTTGVAAGHSQVLRQSHPGIGKLLPGASDGFLTFRWY